MRLDLLRNSAQKFGLDGYVVTRGTSILYFTGFRLADFKDGIGLVTPVSGEAVLLVSKLDWEMAKLRAGGCGIKPVLPKMRAWEAILEVLSDLGLRHVGFDYLDAETYLKLRRETRVRLMPDVVWDLRKVKDEREVALIRRASEIADIGMKVAGEVIRDGMREFEVAAEIEYVMRKHGSQGVAFETIVASGPRSAFPHGWSTSREMRDGDLVIVDIGAVYEGYRSDLTRTFVVGRAMARQKKLYRIVLRAQERALLAMRPGAGCSRVDASARSFISDQGYGEGFIHGLGHGIGLDIHEPPRLNRFSKEALQPGNVVTNEPAIYIPSFGGVRIEDTVLITDDGGRSLTTAEKEPPQ